MEQRDGDGDLGMSFQEIFETAVHASRPSSIESEDSPYFQHFVDDVGGNITQPSPTLVSKCSYYISFYLATK